MEHRLRIYTDVARDPDGGGLEAMLELAGELRRILAPAVRTSGVPCPNDYGQGQNLELVEASGPQD